MSGRLKALAANPAGLFVVFLLAGGMILLTLGLFRLVAPAPPIWPEGVECWRRPVFLRSPGSILRLTGFEDLALDPVSGRVLASAYDRRKGADIGAGEGLFFLGDWLLDPPPAETGALNAWHRAGTLRDNSPDVIPVSAPHGIALEAREDGIDIAAISRRIASGKVTGAEIILWRSDSRGVRPMARYSDLRLKNANDLTFVRDGPNRALALTFDRAAGKDNPGGRVGWLRLPALASLPSPAAISAPAPATKVASNQAEKGFLLVIAPESLHFANGIVALPGTDLADGRGGVLVAETRGARVRTIGLPPLRPLAGDRTDDRAPPSRPNSSFRVPGGPDNLTRNSRGRVIAALHPNLLRYGAYRYDWPPGRLGAILGLRRAASRVVRIDPDSGRVETLLDIPPDAKEPAFHGASVALALGDHLILGGAREDGLMVCRFPPGSLS